MPINVLVVDDDHSITDGLEQLLSQAGQTVSVAGSAEEALQLLNKQTFHLVLTDLQMPGRDGISLAKSVRESCPDTKVAVITAYGSIRTATQAFKTGAFE